MGPAPRPDLATRRARRLAKRFGLPPKMAAILREHLKAEARGGRCPGGRADYLWR